MRDTPWIPPTEQIRVEKILTRETEYLPVPETNETERTRPRAATDAVAWTLPAPSHAPKRGPTVVSCRVVSCRVVLRRDLRRDRRRQVRRRREALRPVHPARAPPLGLAPARARGRRRAPRAAPGMPLICSQSPSPIPLSRIARNHPFDNPPLAMMQLDARGLEMPRRDGARFRVQSKRREKMYYQERLPSFPTQSHISLFLLRARSPISFASSSTS